MSEENRGPTPTAKGNSDTELGALQPELRAFQLYQRYPLVIHTSQTVLLGDHQIAVTHYKSMT